MSKLIDLSGMLIAQWTVLDYIGQQQWRCCCSCGITKPVHTDLLRNGGSRSCGHDRMLRFTRFSHGQAHSRTYISWSSMVQRCTNSKQKAYKNYGAKGIVVCKRWRIFENFFADMGERPLDTSLSRFGDIGNYAPKNCAWHTRKQQVTERHEKDFKAGKGVYQRGNRWRVTIYRDGKKVSLGQFSTKEEALAVKKVALEKEK